MISGDFLTQWKVITIDHHGKGEGKWGGKKGQFWTISYFGVEVFKEVLGLLAYEGTTFMLNLSS